jgi:hypothetical protein
MAPSCSKQRGLVLYPKVKKAWDADISGVHLNFLSLKVEESIVNAPRITDHGSAV